MRQAQHFRIWIVIALGMGLLAGIVPGEEEKTLATPCYMVLASSAEETGGRWASEFSAAKTVDLTLTVVLEKAPTKEQVLELRIFAPSGNLYQSLACPVALPGRKAELRPVPGYPRPKKQLVPRTLTYEGKRYYRVDFAFPVGGTMITSNGLYGKWQIVPYLDGQPIPCGKPALIAIRE